MPMPIAANIGQEVFERILEAPGALVALDTDDGLGMIEQFRLISRRSGQAVYLWRSEDGLAGLREAQMPVPGCLRLGDALRYISQSLHFGVYVLFIGDVTLGATDSALLRQLSNTRTEHIRRVVLMDAPPDAVGALENVLMRIGSQSTASRRRPRLRDGRWVI
jgi:hypothetical protein